MWGVSRRAHCPVLRSSKASGSLEFTLILSEVIAFFFFLGHLHLIAYKTQGIQKGAFGVKYGEILAYFIQSWIKSDEIWAVYW